MTADDKRRVRERIFTDFFLSYGSGQHYLQGITRAKAWNLVSWALIFLGSLGWIAFLMWKPAS